MQHAEGAYSGMILAITVVAEDGARPSPSPTNTRVAHSARRLIFAAGGAMSVPKDQSATPTRSTRAPPILQKQEMPPDSLLAVRYYRGVTLSI